MEQIAKFFGKCSCGSRDGIGWFVFPVRCRGLAYGCPSGNWNWGDAILSPPARCTGLPYCCPSGKCCGCLTGNRGRWLGWLVSPGALHEVDLYLPFGQWDLIEAIWMMAGE